jgi:hypothetical protein
MLIVLPSQNVELIYVPVMLSFFLQECFYTCMFLCVCVCVCVCMLFGVRVEGRVERKICTCV